MPWTRFRSLFLCVAFPSPTPHMHFQQSHAVCISFIIFIVYVGLLYVQLFVGAFFLVFVRLECTLASLDAHLIVVQWFFFVHSPVCISCAAEICLFSRTFLVLVQLVVAAFLCNFFHFRLALFSLWLWFYSTTEIQRRMSQSAFYRSQYPQYECTYELQQRKNHQTIYLARMQKRIAPKRMQRYHKAPFVAGLFLLPNF